MLSTYRGQLRVLSIYRGHYLLGLIESQDREALRLRLIEPQDCKDKEALRVVI